MEAAPIVIEKTVAEDDDWSPEAEAAEEEARLMREAKEQEEKDALDADALREDAGKRMGMLDSLLDKTALYSQFVSTNLKTSEVGGTRSGAKRKATSPKATKKRAKKAGKDKFNLNDIAEQEAADQEQDVDDIGQPALMTGATMRGYQKQGVAWLTSLWENGMNGILGDEMGLGKTIQTIGMMSNLKEKNVKGPYLVVAPLSTLANWNREVPMWTKGQMTSMLYHGTQDVRAGLRAQWGDFDVIITSFEICMRDIKFFQNPRFSK